MDNDVKSTPQRHNPIRNLSRLALYTAAVLIPLTGAFSFAQNRPVVGGLNGVVISNHPMASMAGFEILRQGGNAIDAAVAVSAALGVVEPYLSGPGGEGFLMYYEAETGQTHFLNLTGRAPAALTLDPFLEDSALQSRGPLSSLVPGAVAGWEVARNDYGTMTAAELLAPAIELARNGYVATAIAAREHQNTQARFLDYDEAGATAWWSGSLNPPVQGDVIRNHMLAETYEIMAEEGLMSFYNGTIAEEIVDFYNRFGGVFTVEDFRSLSVGWEEPLQSTYREYAIFTPRPNSSGGLAIPQILNVLEAYDLASMGLNSPEFIHIFVEAIKLAAADRAEWAGDPDFMENEIPYELLLSKEYADERRTLIDENSPASDVQAGVEQPGTSHIAVTDAAGNMVAMTMTLGSGWGSGVVAGETGILLNNGVNWFELDPESPAVVEGGKRTRWNMAPAVLLRDGQPWGIIGASGGTTIWQTIPQVLTKIIDFGLDVQSAVESPRFAWTLNGLRVNAETRIEAEVLEELRSMGHDINESGDWAQGLGSVHVIVVNPETGAMQGGADRRRDGYAIAW